MSNLEEHIKVWVARIQDAEGNMRVIEDVLVDAYEKGVSDCLWGEDWDNLKAVGRR